jgi:two-component system, chemotaxis family, response regulator PixH
MDNVEGGEMAKILVVDDSALILQILSEYLRDGGYEVVTANDGMEAISAVRREGPDAIIMDIMMPGMDGHSVAKLIKMDNKMAAIPIIVFSDLESEKDREISAKIGAVAHLKKGATQDEVLKVVEDALAK